MRRVFIIAILIGLNLLASASFAAGGCPDTADRLEEYARCLVPTRNGMGMRYIGTVADLDGNRDHTYAAMAASPIIPPTPNPGGQGIISPMYPFYYPLNPFYPPSFGAYMYSSAGGNPAMSAYWNFRFGPGY